MDHPGRSIVAVLAGIVALGPASTPIPAQVTVDLENRYSNVGVLMVWRVDDAGKPVELRGFASGTLIRGRVMVTAGHFTGPATALGSLPPIDPNICQLQSDRREGSEDLDSRRSVRDAPLDAALSAASMRPDRRQSGRATPARDRRRRVGLPRTRAARYPTSAPRRARHAR